MSAQLNANTSRNNNFSPIVVNKGRHHLKNDWKCLQRDVFIDHIGREWYKVEFFYERILNEDVLRDLVAILGTPIQVDEESLLGRPGMFVRACLELDLTKLLKRNFLQVERLENEPDVYHIDTELDEDMQQKIVKVKMIKDNSKLMADISELEIFEAVRSIGALKAPGPETRAILFHQFWAEIKHLLIQLVKIFVVNNLPLNSINHTNIALIPKVDNPEVVPLHLRGLFLTIS
ncbi:PREDICTED: reverse mRNAase [Prunus dulcis]|uniref:PREDICTED: reverse mRNAase n=1 Tax=Prunus dulcis TaxID=3755 RepID=A0A5E4FU07_PRUDU|nr:PREDICTED: reverse mRNAase [Prunus dulcis]